MRTVAHNVRDRHAGHTDGGHRIAQGSKAFLIAQNPDKGIAFFADGCLFQAGGKFQRERRQTAGVYRTVGVNTECRLNWKKVGIGAGETVLGHVQSLNFLLRTCAQTDCCPDHPEDQNHTQHRIRPHGQHSETLHAQLAKTASVEKPLCTVGLIAGKEPDGNRSPDSVDTVYRHCADRVIHMKVDIQDFKTRGRFFRLA